MAFRSFLITSLHLSLGPPRGRGCGSQLLECDGQASGPNGPATRVGASSPSLQPSLDRPIFALTLMMLSVHSIAACWLHIYCRRSPASSGFSSMVSSTLIRIGAQTVRRLGFCGNVQMVVQKDRLPECSRCLCNPLFYIQCHSARRFNL